MGYSNDRLSLAQEIKETLEVNGQWTPKNYAGSDIIMAVGKALAAKDAEIAKLREENQRIAKQAKIEVLEGILANAENWHFENYGYPLRGETGHEAVAIELRETLNQLEGER